MMTPIEQCLTFMVVFLFALQVINGQWMKVTGACLKLVSDAQIIDKQRILWLSSRVTELEGLLVVPYKPFKTYAEMAKECHDDD